MIEKLSLFDFRNYEEKHFEFTEKNVVFYGGNGQGKTNILEALSILSVGKSWRETSSEDLIRENSKAGTGVIQATLDNGNLYEAKIAPRSRVFEKNAKKVSLRQHFGKIPTLLFVPEHLMLFSGTKRNRQRFFDRFLFQISPHYRENLMKFNRALKQKNALLKSFRDPDPTSDPNPGWDPDPSLLAPWNKILAETIPLLVQVRQEFLAELNPLLQKELQGLSRTTDTIEVRLEIAEVFTSSEMTKEFVLDFFTKNSAREQAAGKCLFGPHRDDFVFYYRDKPILSTASRGEERSVMLAMLAAQKHILKALGGPSPILLLDDVFSELDQSRQNYLENLCNESQIFFTTTHESHFENFSHPVQKIEI
jgi:DNA replication and repair protein RecF